MIFRSNDIYLNVYGANVFAVCSFVQSKYKRIFNINMLLGGKAERANATTSKKI